jgi:hypothetical protein
MGNGPGQLCVHKGDERDQEVTWTYAISDPYFSNVEQPLTPTFPQSPFGPSNPSAPKCWRISLQQLVISYAQKQSTGSALLGFRLCDTRGGAVVSSVEAGGAVELFNNQWPDQAIREGDLIVEVNGLDGSCRAINSEVWAGHPLDLMIERFKSAEVEWIVEIDRENTSLGLQFDNPSRLDGSTLRVARSSSSAIRRGDLILQVNAEATSAANMAAELMEAQTSKVRVSRKKVTRGVKFQEDVIDDVFCSNSDSDCETPDEPNPATPYFVRHHVSK